jgi:DnaJ family protein A protein 5
VQFACRVPWLIAGAIRIKKAYRKKALELHPDRNYGNVENATVLFAEVQAAYEVLSDPHERAWYDSHRDAILRNGDVGDDRYGPDSQVKADYIVTLIGRLTKITLFDDSPTGFYGSLRSAFETLAQEEDTACEWEGLEYIPYPSFGGVNDSYEDVVKPFYASWSGFSTRKTFSWVDVHRYADAPDRRIRRLMEKENKRLRDEAIREYNDAVRSLVSFVRKRDPRYVPNTLSEQDRQALLREAATAQAARSRAANQAKLDESSVPEWATTQDAEEHFVSESEESEQECYECVVCSKIFKSEKQYEAHERSKKHIKAVEQLKREMKKENKDLALDASIVPGPPSPQEKGDEHEAPSEKPTREPEEIPNDGPTAGVKISTVAGPSDQATRQNSMPGAEPQDTPLVDGQKPLSGSNSPITEPLDGTSMDEPSENDLSDNEYNDSHKAALTTDSDEPNAPKKLGKAKAKKAKKAARLANANSSDPSAAVSLQRNVCITLAKVR